MKYILYIFIGFFIQLNNLFATQANHPAIFSNGMPFANRTVDSILNISGGHFVTLAIKYVAVIAVIALMLSGIMYLIAGGEEEKVKKAKTWIIWSLAGVLLSISAWGIITSINRLIIVTPSS